MYPNNIAVIIVLYNPQQNHLNQVKEISACYYGAIVDNSENPSFQEDMVNNMIYIPLHANMGIAKAQNIGIKRCLDNNDIDTVVFLDQDSKIARNYPTNISFEFQSLKERYPNLGILGPTAIDELSQKSYKATLHNEHYLASDLYIRPKIISSGACTSREILESVGLNDESLFIDFVDSEWCWRAGSKGYICGMSPTIKITHHIGKKTINFGLFSDIISSPNRYYFQFRNFLWLLRINYVPIKWKIKEGLKYIFRLFYVPLFTHEGSTSFKYIWKGISAGIRHQKRIIPQLMTGNN